MKFDFKAATTPEHVAQIVTSFIGMKTRTWKIERPDFLVDHLSVTLFEPPGDLVKAGYEAALRRAEEVTLFEPPVGLVNDGLSAANVSDIRVWAKVQLKGDFAARGEVARFAMRSFGVAIPPIDSNGRPVFDGTGTDQWEVHAANIIDSPTLVGVVRVGSITSFRCGITVWPRNSSAAIEEGPDTFPEVKELFAKIDRTLRTTYGIPTTNEEGPGINTPWADEPWKAILNQRDQHAVNLWWQGYTKPEIATKLKIGNAKTLENQFCLLRRTYTTDVVPYANDPRRRKGKRLRKSG